MANRNDPDPANVNFSFDTTGGTSHISQSFATRAYATPGAGSIPTFNGSIGVTRDGVDGVDLVIPTLKFSEEHKFDASIITDAWVANIAAATGTVNSLPWRAFAGQQVLFHGVSGNSEPDGYVNVTFNFEVGVNATGLSVAGAIVDKYAWDYLWVYSTEQLDSVNNRIYMKPQFVYVETVYNQTDFNQLGI